MGVVLISLQEDVDVGPISLHDYQTHFLHSILNKLLTIILLALFLQWGTNTDPATVIPNQTYLSKPTLIDRG